MSYKRIYLLIAVLAVISTAIFIYLGGATGRDNLFTRDSGSLKAAAPVFPPSGETLYRMGLYLDTTNLTLLGRSDIETRNNCFRPLKELYFGVYPNAFREKSTSPAPVSAYPGGFDPGGIEVTGVKVNRQPVEFITRGVSLQVLLPEDILPGERVDISLSWKVKIPRVAYRFGAQDGTIVLGDFYPVLSVHRGEEWLPTVNTPYGDPFCFQCADYLVKMNLPSDYQVVSTGRILAREAEDSGRDTVLMAAEQVRDFAIIASFRYQNLDSKTMETTVKCFTLDGNEEVRRRVLAEAVRILKYYACTFGSYPYPEFKIAEVPMEGFQGMEHSGVVFLQQEVFSPGYDNQKRDFLLAHEIAHQWWFGLVGNDQVREPWLDEGLANWSARHYLKNVKGINYPAGYVSCGNVNLSRPLDAMKSKADYIRTTYAGGEAFWSGLETELGEKTVIRCLRRYLADYRYRVASTDDIKECIETEAGRDMEPYFKKWFQN